MTGPNRQDTGLPLTDFVVPIEQIAVSFRSAGRPFYLRLRSDLIIAGMVGMIMCQEGLG